MVLFISPPKMLHHMLFLVALLCYSGLADAAMLNLLNNPTDILLLQSLSQYSNVAVSMDDKFLTEASYSIINAETWLRTHVLTHYPALQITTIVVGNNVLCNNTHEDKWDLVLPSLNNIHHSLVRWGLEKDIKVSASLSTECLHPFSFTYREDLADRVIKPLLNFLQHINSSISVNAPSNFSPLVNAHKESIKKLGYFQLCDINVVRQVKPKRRKLSVDPFPARPTPLPELSPSSPIHSSIGFSVPATIAKTPLPPLVQPPPPPSLTFPFSPQAPSLPPLAQTSQPPFMSFPFAPQASTPSPFSSPPQPPPMSSFPFAPQATPPPSMSFPFPPQGPPLVIPSSPPPDYYYYPPCSAAPAPSAGEEKGFWCVAKPSVPEEKLKEAMDYACGAGGGDCEEIGPHGSCYYPDTMVAHASYAFNSYWQKNKVFGGTCDFGGTAMVINANPSFEHCRFILS